jgi:glucose-6-phosphate 1-epimerase
VEGRGGLAALRLRAGDGARAELYLHGAHVTSWAPAGAGEQLFLSARSAFEAGTAIRGGIPVIFPQFGPGPLPKHGFARTAAWELAGSGDDAAGGGAHATLALGDSPATRALWPAAFAAELRVEVAGRTLAVSLSVENRGAAPIAFTGALHSYFRVEDAARATVEGLSGVRYRDQAAGGGEAVDAADALAFTGEVDRVYIDPPADLRLRDGGAAGARALAIHAAGFPDAVVWNPWADKARQLPDLADAEYREMVCVEAAAAAEPVVVAPDGRWTGTQRVTLL